jgi:hypothetical protein
VVNDDEACSLSLSLAFALAGLNKIRMIALATTLLGARLEVSRPFVHALSS